MYNKEAKLCSVFVVLSKILGLSTDCVISIRHKQVIKTKNPKSNNVLKCAEVRKGAVRCYVVMSYPWAVGHSEYRKAVLMYIMLIVILLLMMK